MSAKSENAWFETIVREALEKMRAATSASSSYEVDRSGGQWIVRRASSASEKGFASDIVANLIGVKDG